MHLFSRLLIFISFVSVLSEGVAASHPLSNHDVPEQVSTALAVGNAKDVSQFFNASVQLIILNKEGMYNRDQAEQILRYFFSQHTPSKFVLRHEGGAQTKDSRFIIGTLQTDKGNYRISMFMKVTDNNNITIHQLRIEEDNE